MAAPPSSGHRRPSPTTRSRRRIHRNHSPTPSAATSLLPVMKARLPGNVTGPSPLPSTKATPLDLTLADFVASAAMRTGAHREAPRHYAHVFYPLTGFTAESTILPRTRRCRPPHLPEFQGKTLLRVSPMRRAPQRRPSRHVSRRGLHRQDVTSPAYHSGEPQRQYLCIPTISSRGPVEYLDKKICCAASRR